MALSWATSGRMKVNIACPSTGSQKQIKVEEDSKLRCFYEKRLAAEVDGAVLGDEWKGYVLKIAGGNDKQGFGMKQGCLIPGRAHILMTPGDQCFRGYGRRNGERRRKGVRGCIVTPDLSVLNLIITKIGESPIPGLTDKEIPKLRGPKRASTIRKLFALSKDDDVRKYVNIYRRTKEEEDQVLEGQEDPEGQDRGRRLPKAPRRQDQGGQGEAKRVPRQEESEVPVPGIRRLSNECLARRF